MFPTRGEIKKKGYVLPRDSEVTLRHWSRSIECGHHAAHRFVNQS
jgi:hypothetical protein